MVKHVVMAVKTMFRRGGWVLAGAAGAVLGVWGGFGFGGHAWGAGITINLEATRQTIDGFGTCTYATTPDQSWYSNLYYDDLGASMLRVDMTPKFKSPYSDRTYNSPWFHGQPSLPGPSGNNVRSYTNATTYTQTFAGQQAQIAVMGPDLNQNISRYFDFGYASAASAGRLAKAGADRVTGGPVGGGDPNAFKLIGSIWSPAPWLKVSTGNTIQDNHSFPLPANGAAYPFVWFDNFAGGKLDTSGVPRAEFNDASQGGAGNTSALTQFARSTAAYIAGYQRTHGVKFAALSLQNEPFLEVFYNSALYKTSGEYIAAIKAVRTEFDRHDELRSIQFFGSEDTIGSESTFLWYWDGQQGGRRDKVLKFMQDIEADPVASAALPFYGVHGYAADGISSANSSPQVWNWVRDGWGAAPNPSVPANVKGYQDYGKKAWMTETSGEATSWLAYRSGSSFPSEGAFSIAIKLHQALTAGEVTAWMYWQLADGEAVGSQTATDSTLLNQSPKFVALKHFYKFIRPGMKRVDVSVSSGPDLETSAFYAGYPGSTAADGPGTLLTIVMVNVASSANLAQITLPADLNGSLLQIDSYTSSNNLLWQYQRLTVVNGVISLSVPGYGVSTVVLNRVIVIPEAGSVMWLGVAGLGLVRCRR